jgi:hypothetical protein
MSIVLIPRFGFQSADQFVAARCLTVTRARLTV